MTSEVFREKVGGHRITDKGVPYLEKPNNFKDVVIKKNLRVIARATPDDKVLLTVGLKEH